MRSITDITAAFRDLRREYQAEYQAANPSRFRRTRGGAARTSGVSGDYSIANESRHFRLIEYIRDMHRNDGIVGQATRRATQQQVQNGFSFDPDTGDKALNEDLKADFRDWAIDPERCDIAGEREFSDMESDVHYSMLRDGDILGLGLESGHLQLIESHLVRTPSRTRKNVVLGVRLDEYRRRIGYHVVADQIDPWKSGLLVSEAPLLPTRDSDGVRQIFHVLMPERVSLTRGISAWIPVVDIAGMYEDSNFALLVKQQVTSAIAIFFEQEYIGQPAFNPQTGPRETVQAGAGDSLTDLTNEELSPGQKIALPPGVTAKPFSPNIQSSEAIAHQRALIQIIGLNLGLPLGIVLLDPTDASWSGLRTVWDAAKIGFRCNQAALARRWHKPIWRWRIHWRMQQDDSFAMALRRWAEKLGPRLMKVTVKPPSWPYLQPLDDARAKALKRSTLQISPRRDAAEMGEDFDDIVAETVADMGSAIRAAKAEAARINSEFPDDPSRVNWRDVLNLDLYKGGTQFDSRDVADDRKQTAGAGGKGSG